MFVSYCFALVRSSMASQHVMGVGSVCMRGKAFFIVLHTLPRLTMTAAPSSMTRLVATMHLLDSVVMIRTGEDMECWQSSICSAALLSETMAQMKGCLGIGGTRQG